MSDSYGDVSPVSNPKTKAPSMYENARPPQSREFANKTGGGTSTKDPQTARIGSLSAKAGKGNLGAVESSKEPKHSFTSIKDRAMSAVRSGAEAYESMTHTPAWRLASGALGAGDPGPGSQKGAVAEKQTGGGKPKDIKRAGPLTAPKVKKKVERFKPISTGGRIPKYSATSISVKPVGYTGSGGSSSASKQRKGPMLVKTRGRKLGRY